MGGSESHIQDLESSGIQLYKSYKLCCANCCTPKQGEDCSPDKKSKWIACKCCEKTYYCSRRCWHENAENHIEAHKLHGEVVLLILEPNEKQRNIWHRASVNSVGLRGHNPRTGAVRISLGVSPVNVNVNIKKGTGEIVV